MPGSNDNPQREMPFAEHLEELRWHLLRSILYVTVLAALSWYYYDAIYHLVSTPVKHAFESADYTADLVYMDILEPLYFRLQVVLAAAVILALPLIIWEIWRFVAPGLFAEERRFAAPLIPFSIVLCFAGCVLVYYALPIAFEFLLKFAPPSGEARVMQHLQRYYFFLLRMMIGAAVAFQTPVVLLLMGKLELVTSRGLMRFWRHSVLVCFTIAAIITPTIDPFNMAIIAVPLVSLYFLSVVLVWFVEVGRRRRASRETSDGPGEPPPPPPAPEPDVAPPPPLATAPPPIDRSILGPLPTTEPDAEDEALFNPEE